MNRAPCILPRQRSRMRASADLESLTFGYGVNGTGSDAECTPASRPFRKHTSPSVQSGSSWRSVVAGNVGRRSEVRDKGRACNTGARRSHRSARLEQGDGRLAAPYGIPAESFLTDAVGMLSAAHHRNPRIKSHAMPFGIWDRFHNLIDQRG